MVFMNGVVAVHGPVAAKIAEAEEELNRLVERQATDVFPRVFHPRNPSRPLQDPELFQMDVDGMLPATGVVPYYPPFRGVSLARETDGGVDGETVCNLSVDLPLAIAPHALEGASNPRRHLN